MTKENCKVMWVPPCGAVSQNKMAGMVRGARGAPWEAEMGTGDRTKAFSRTRPTHTT